MDTRDSRGQYITMRDGAQIYCRQLGAGPPLLMLHGNAGSSRYFKGQVDELSRHFQLILVDSRGHGRSSNPSLELSFTMMAEDLYELLNYLGINQTHILGFSDGANLALVFEKLYPNYVKSIILNAGNISFEGLTPWTQWSIKLQAGVLSLLSPFSQWARRYLSITQLMLHPLPVSWADLRRCQVPCLILIGSLDMVTRSHALKMTSQLPQGYFTEIHGQGHFLARRRPQLFNHIVLEFIQYFRTQS